MRTRIGSLLGLLSLAGGAGCSMVDAVTIPDLDPWAKSFHGTAESAASGMAIASGPDGKLFVGGVFEDNVNLGGGNLVADAGTAVMIAHLGPDGEHLWSGSTGSNDSVSSVAINADSALFVGGSYDGAINFGSGKLTGYKNGYFAGFNPLGKSIYNKALGGEAEDWVDDIATTPFGDVYVVARAGDDADFGAGAPSESYSKRDAVVAFYAPAGHHLWDVRISGAFFDELSVASDPEGDAVITGVSYSDIQLGKLTAGPGPFVAKISDTGGPMWLRVATPSEYGYARFHEVAIGPEGRVFVSGAIYYSTATINGFSFGDLNGGRAFWLALSPGGDPLHIKEIDTNDDYTVPEIAAAPNGDVLVGLTVESAVDLGGGLVGFGLQQNIVLGRFTRDGQLVRYAELAGNANESLGDLTVDVDDNPVITGWFNGDLEIAGTKLTAEGARDMFVARLDL